MKFNFCNLKLCWLIKALVIGFIISSPTIANDSVRLKKNYTKINNTKLVLSEILTSEDTVHYRRIFEFQESGNWKYADKLIDKLGDHVLMGHVMAQRYLHPTKYRSRYKELKLWMAKYADHPDAPRIYKLARMRQPKNFRAPKRPIRISRKIIGAREATSISIPGRKLNRTERQRVRQLKRNIRSRLKRGFTLSVKKQIRTKEMRRLFSNAEYDQAKARLGQGYFLAGRDSWAPGCRRPITWEDTPYWHPRRRKRRRQRTDGA